MAIDRVGLSILRQRRVLNLLTVAFLSRVAVAASPLALLIALADVYGFAIAAVIDGVYTILLAGLSPLRARLLDLIGPRVALMAMTAASVTSMTLVAWGISRAAAWPIILTGIIFAGISAPPLNAALRVSWRQAVSGPEALKVVHLADSIVEEIGFILGPSLAGLGFALLSPQVTYRVTVAAAAAAVVLYLIAAKRYRLGERPPTGGPDTSDPEMSQDRRTGRARWFGPLALPVMAPILAPLLVMGLMFGGLGVFIPAYTIHLGILGWSGVLIGLISVGGVIGGVVHGALTWKAGIWTRHRIFATGFTIPCCLLIFGLSPWVLAVLLLIAGLFVTPLFGTAFLLVDEYIPRSMRHEASAWVGASTDLANGVSAICIGLLVAQGEWRTALAILSAAALVCLIIVRMSRVPATGQSSKLLAPTT